MATKRPNFVVSADGAAKILRKPSATKPAPLANRAQHRRVLSQLRRAEAAMRRGRRPPPMDDVFKTLFGSIFK